MRRLPMKKNRKILLLRLEQDKPVSTILKMVPGVKRTMAYNCVRRALAAELTAAKVKSMSDFDLKQLLYPPKPVDDSTRPEPDYVYIHKELAKKIKGVNIDRLWREYKQVHPDGYERSQFFAKYRAWKQLVKRTLRMDHKPGECLYLDWAGPTCLIQNPKTGEVKEFPVFVATLAVSNYTYMEVCDSAQLESFINATIRALEFIGGVPELLVPDNVKTAVTKASRHEPTLSLTYEDMADHYDTAICPARPRKPQDKAKVEAGVKAVESKVMAPLRYRTFFSLKEANAAYWEQLKELNEEVTPYLKSSRRELFEQLEQSKLKPLRSEPYQFGIWQKARVRSDYTVRIGTCHYSVPYNYIGVLAGVKIMKDLVEIYHDDHKIASHQRLHHEHGLAMELSHLAPEHKQYVEWTPTKILQQAAEIGPHATAFVTEYRQTKKHDSQWCQACFGLFNLVNNYGADRFELACKIGLKQHAKSIEAIKGILQSKLDQQEHLDSDLDVTSPLHHENIRGMDRFIQ